MLMESLMEKLFPILLSRSNNFYAFKEIVVQIERKIANENENKAPRT